MHAGHILLIALYEQHELEKKSFERCKGTTPTFA
jgi:hypothetical protein